MDHLPSIRRRSSLFTINPVDSGSTSTELVRYEKQLRFEIKQWTHLLRAKSKKMQQLRSAPCQIDQTFLSDEQRKYLADSPKVDQFIAETEAFDKAVTAYVIRKSFLMERNAHIVQEVKALVELELKDKIANELEESIVP
ncbi:uncharacterized protein LOC126565589 [Anopheles maculipalpis]|uniref:uncharacterized protein LOC126565589 n=1 Tax=Anopheles maculipalpis TaxID=1496333 RepID=UPI002158DF0B|nr:uncharacterized protein LOC126565589 [Anopheles maculipalpis]